MRYESFAALGLILLLAACDLPQRTTEAASQRSDVQLETVTPITNVKRATIDWDAARRDFAARTVPNDATLSIAGSSNPPVPVLLPDQPVSVARAGGTAMQFRPTADGYFAVIPGSTYDLIINGSDRLIVPDSAANPSPSEALNFEETLTGAQVSFQRYGASYLAEFMCKAPETARVGSCVTAEDAKQVVNDLLISGTR